MAKIELLMPKMGESIIEATILKWVKNEGDQVNVDDTILEIATDKVDSEIPSPVNGTIIEVKFPQDSVVAVGEVIAIIESSGATLPLDSPTIVTKLAEPEQISSPPPTISADIITQEIESIKQSTSKSDIPIESKGDRFYSPLVKNIAKEENISQNELDLIPGTGANERLTKYDLLLYIEDKNNSPKEKASISTFKESPTTEPINVNKKSSGNNDIIEMDRMRKLIADHMVMSKQTSPHVTSFVEADVTDLVKWRDKNKLKFREKYGENLTFTPLFIEAVVKAIQDFPMVNVSLEGTKIIVKKDINIGIAAALPTGNLIVPVVKNAAMFSLTGLAKKVNDLAGRARENKLKPDEIQDGTFTLTNVGTFGNLMGTPIINQPQVAILATGAIIKKPAVLETEYGDIIAIRHMMFLSLSYDHRVVDGALGGAFLKRISEYLEKFDAQTSI